MDRKKVITVFIPLMLILIVSTYIWMGGLSEIEWQNEESVSLIMLGKYYEGEYGDDFIKETFFEVKEKLSTEEWSGQLAVLYYNRPEDAEGKVKNFIGALVRDTLQRKEGFEYRTYHTGSALRATLKAHNMVMPNPADVYEKSFAKAQESGMELGDVFIEIYISNKQLEILFLDEQTIEE